MELVDLNEKAAHAQPFAFADNIRYEYRSKCRKTLHSENLHTKSLESIFCRHTPSAIR
jgi:hypothetical protein